MYYIICVVKNVTHVHFMDSGHNFASLVFRGGRFSLVSVAL